MHYSFLNSHRNAVLTWLDFCCFTHTHTYMYFFLLEKCFFIFCEVEFVNSSVTRVRIVSIYG